jgi:glycolate oxidase iron-sulfur subunit
MHRQQLGGALARVLGKVGVLMSRTKENHLCCGSAGTYSILQPQISQRLLDRKLAALSVDAPDQLVTANIGCQLHLGAQSDVPVKHWIELLDSKTS